MDLSRVQVHHLVIRRDGRLPVVGPALVVLQRVMVHHHSDVLLGFRLLEVFVMSRMLVGCLPLH